MNLGQIDKVILVSIVIGIVINAASGYISEKAPNIGLISAISVASLVGIWAIYRLSKFVYQNLKRGRYAVLIFLIDSDYRLLLIKHPFHGVYIPPGGRLNASEPPHMAVARVLSEEVGLDRFEFHPLFHERDIQLSEVVQQVPRPFAVHMERRSQRDWVPFHYAFLYVCRPTLQPFIPPDSLSHKPRWFNLEEVYNLPHGDYPFDDIVRRYEQILGRLGQQVKAGMLDR